jgi:hypothetical protein
MEVICANASCSKPFIWKGGKVHFARSSVHHCSRKCQNTTHGLAGTPRHKIWEGAKKRAKENDVVFTLALDDIPQIPTRCPVLGIEIRANTKAGPLDSSPSIDRITASLGYVPGNVRIISNRANRLRSDATSHELRLLAADCAKLEAQNAKV